MNMKTLWWAAVAYLVIVGGAEIYSNTATDSATADQVAKLPSPGSLLQTTGSVGGVGSFAGVSSAGLVDLLSAGAVYWFALR